MNLKKISVLAAGLMTLAACTNAPSADTSKEQSETVYVPITSTCILQSDTMDLQLIVDGVENEMVTSVTIEMKTSYEDWGSSKDDMVGMNEIVTMYFNDLLAQSLGIEDENAMNADSANIFTDEAIDYKASVDIDALSNALGIDSETLTVEALTESLNSSSFACDAIKPIGN